MPRTTLNIDASVLRELKRRQQRDGRPLGAIASELLARALADGPSATEPEPLAWNATAMGARVDLHDKDAVARALDGR